MIDMSNLEEFAQTVGRDVKALNQKPEPRLTLTGITLGIVGGNHVTLPLPDNVGQEIRGTGSPEGRITAEIGTTYVDVNVTNGALKWIKESGNGNTGWKVIHGDTGWVLGWQHDMNGKAINKMYFRRINDVVHVKFEPEISNSIIDSRNNLILESGSVDLYSELSIQGFQPVDDIIQTIFSNSQTIYSEMFVEENSQRLTGSGAVVICYDYNGRHRERLELHIVTSQLGNGENHVNPLSYLTEDEWPTTLPTIGG